MAIDRIGKGGPALPDSSGAAPATTAKATLPFTIDRADPAASASSSASSVEPGSPLGRLRAGEVDVHGYVDLRVEEATKSLRGMPAAELDAIKSVLRDQLRTDPGLADLVRLASGKTPSPPED